MLDKNLKKPARGVPHPIDAHVGHRLRMQRNLAGLSQGELGKAIGLTFQQIQKYEQATNRISASKLYELSCELNVPVSYFFEGIADQKAENLHPAYCLNNGRIEFGKESQKLILGYYKITDINLRAKVSELICAMVSDEIDNNDEGD